MIQKFLSVLVWAYWTVCFNLILLIITILFVITYPFDRFRKIPNGALHWLAIISLKPIPTWKFEIRGADLAKVCKPTIVVANHQSFLDLPLLNLLPFQMKWITKKSMLKIPVLGWMIRMTGHISIERKSLRSLKAMHALIEPVKHGIPGMIFPEGSRTRDGRIQPFKKGAFVVAKKYNFNILPIVVKGGFEAMPAGSWPFKFHNNFVISVMQPLNSASYKSAEDLKDHAEKLIKQELESLQISDNREL